MSSGIASRTRSQRRRTNVTDLPPPPPTTTAVPSASSSGPDMPPNSTSTAGASNSDSTISTMAQAVALARQFLNVVEGVESPSSANTLTGGADHGKSS